MAGRLGIHVIGPRYGESIILELPDGAVGVIDCFASRRGRHPVVEFLASHFPTLKQLRFFAITHPHADHCFRAADVIARFPAEEVWVFRPFPAGYVQEYYKALEKHGATDAIEAALDLPAGSVADSLLQFDNQIGPPIKKHALHYRPLAGGCRPFDLCGGKLRLHFLTPGDQSQYAYAAQLKSAAQAIFADGPALVAANRLPQPDHNLASGGVLLEYGETRLLLMSDAEAPRWDEWLASSPPTDLLRPVHFVKVAHHGSANGHHLDLYKRVAHPRLTVAVVTPFNHGKVHLPTAAGVQAMRSQVRDLYCTNRHAAEESTELHWDTVVPAALPRIPGRWTAMLRRRPALGSLLVSDARVPAPAEPVPPLPLEWVTDAQKSPALWRLVRPSHRLPTATPDASDAHTVSAYFDTQGTLLELRTGDGAGRLNP